MKISLPISITSQIGFSAARRARQYAAGRGWNIGSVSNNGSSTSIINPVFGVGYAGLKTGSKHLMFQERGTKPFLMTALEGKTVPIKGPNGLHFVKVKDVGKPGYVTLPDGHRVWRNQKWRHPGIQRTDFMANSIAYAVLDNRPLINSLMGSLIGYSGGIQP